MLMTRQKLREALPRSFVAVYRVGRSALNRWKFRGRSYYCNVCDSHLRSWIHVGPSAHQNFVCPVCYSYGRHRLMALVIEREILGCSSDANRTLLHFAPEIGLQSWIRRQAPFLKYFTADLFSPDVDLNLDLQRIELPDNSVDFIVLSHVLEHVVDDSLALKELYRIVAPGGMLFIQVPLSGEQTTREEKLDTPEERLASYGKTDHLRLYGEDIATRLTAAGFSVTAYMADADPYRDKFDYMALDLPGSSTMLYDNESTTFKCIKPN